MKPERIPTEYLPAERLPGDEIETQSEFLASIPFLRKIIDFIPDIVIITNRQRQIILANKALKQLPELESVDPIYGLRPGEVLQCVHSDTSEGGCGTTEFCKTCGVAETIRQSGIGNSAMRECRITRKKGLGVLDLRVKGSPLTIEGESFSFFVITDISHEKRRHALERIFFHDILNVAGNIKGLFDIIRMDGTIDDMYAERMASNINFMIDEIKAQKDLVAAENNELVVRPELVDSIDFIQQVIDFYKYHKSARKRGIVISDETEKIAFTTDRFLLSRVLGNMVKNALEASNDGDSVTIWCRKQGDHIEFSVHNHGVMERKVQLQIFQRSFSTKSANRGLGTYSMKLLTERYLGGSISFSSSEETGTIFKARIPLIIPLNTEPNNE